MIQIHDKQEVVKLQGRTQQTEGCCTPVPVAVREGTEEQVKLMAAMSDPTRLQIVVMLAGQSEPLCVCEIQGNFNLGQPTISHHLKVLRDAGLVSGEKRGLWVYYSLERGTLQRATNYLNNLLSPAASASLIG